MKIDIEWELTEEIGVEFLKESYITLREQVELDKKQVELDCYNLFTMSFII
jgi:hypothetical protein